MTDVYLSCIGIALGRPEPVSALPEVLAAGSGPLLNKEGLVLCRIAAQSPWELAAEAVGATLNDATKRIDAVVYATGSDYDDPGDQAMGRLLAASNLPQTPAYGVGLAGCANLAAALQVARNLVLTQQSDVVLVATSDVSKPGERLMGANLAVLSDGAASCLVSAAPLGTNSLRLLDIRIAVNARMDADAISANALAALRDTVMGIRRASSDIFEANGFSASDVTRLILHNYGAAGARILSSAVGVPAERIWSPTAAEVGHCFAADVLINLAALLADGRIGPLTGQRLMGLITGSTTWGCVALEGV